MLMISVSENQSDFLQNKIRPFLAQGICIYVGHIIFKHSWTSSINLSFSLESGVVV
jgi:hypothetical protein